jgi:hypothetical protein
VGRTICGRKKIKIRIVLPLRFRGKNAYAFVERRQPSSFLHLAKIVKSDGLMSYKRAFAVGLSTCKFTFQGPYSFRDRGNPQECKIFNKAEPMYLEAIIKAFIPKTVSIFGQSR